MVAEEGREYDIVPNPYAKESEGPMHVREEMKKVLETMIAKYK